MQKKYFIQQYLLENYKHGGIGLVDAEKVLVSAGYKPILLPHQTGFSFWAKVSRLFFLVKVVFSTPNGAVIVFLFPMYAKMTRLLVHFLKKRKDVTLVCFITDIDGIKDDDTEKLKF